MFATQFRPWTDLPKENTGTLSPVTTVPCKGNSERIAQMILTGQFLEADRVGYQFSLDDPLPERIRTLPSRGADITEVLACVEETGRRIRQYVHEKQTQLQQAETARTTESKTKTESEDSKSIGRGQSGTAGLDREKTQRGDETEAT